MDYEALLIRIMSDGARDRDHAVRAFKLMDQHDDLEIYGNDKYVAPDQDVIDDAIDSSKDQ